MLLGIDYNRLTLLIAVLEKRAGLLLGTQDVYLNIAGGIKINEPALDLAIVLAAASSFKNTAVPKRNNCNRRSGLDRRSKKRTGTLKRE